MVALLDGLDDDREEMAEDMKPRSPVELFGGLGEELTARKGSTG